METNKFFDNIGLTKEETAIYLFLLEKGPRSIFEIAKSIELDRSTVYRLVAKLEGRSLVSKTPRGKRILYAAEPPEKLELLIQNISNEFGAILPKLKDRQPRNNIRPIVKFLEGRKGIVAVYDDIAASLKRGETFYRYSSAKTSRERNRYVSPTYVSTRDSKRLERYVITNSRTEKEKNKRPRLERYIKTVPPSFDLFEFDVTLLIYGSKIALVDYNSETAVIIENPVIASFQKKIFQLLFKLL